MKRLFLIFSVYCLNIIYVFANSSFNKETNYQFKNIPALKGETLYLVPLTGSNYTDLFDQPIEHYHNFMDYDRFWKEDFGLMYTGNQYKYDAFNYLDAMVAGTHKRWIEGHRFYVDDVKRIEDYDDWVLYLTDLNTGEKVKYVCNGEKKYTRIDMENFPFIVEKHYNYLKSLIGTNLVFATNGYGMFLEESYAPFYNNSYETDINTEKKINYTTSYVKWTIKNVGYDVYEMALYFIVSDGKNTTKVYYDNQYSEQHPTYNIGNRVFTEKQWNKLVNKYGEQHMSLIMSTKISNDMTLEEKYMSGGRKFAKKKNSSTDFKLSKSDLGELKEAGIIIKNTVKKSFDDTKNNVVEIFKAIWQY